MSNEKLINERIRKITERILEDYKNGRDIDKMRCCDGYCE